MRRYILVTGDFVRTGGMDVANYALADYLARHGEDVHLVTFRASEDLAAYPNVTVHKVPRPLGSHLVGAPLLGAAALLFARSRGARVVVNGGNVPIPAINWVHYVHAAYAPRSAVGWGHDVKERVSHGLARTTERAALRRARRIVANSIRTREDIEGRVGVPPGRTVTVYYGCDPSVLRAVDAGERVAARLRLGWDERPRAVFIGALGNRRKGFDIVWDAWTHVCRDPSWTCKLVVIGQGSELDRWRARCRAEELEDRVDFLGFRKDVPDLLRASDLLIAPSRYEPYGLGVHEALCCGLPAVVSSISGIAERYPQSLKDLVLPDPGDVRGLVEKLRHWRAHESALRQAARLFGETLRARTWDDMAREIHALCESVSWP